MNEGWGGDVVTVGSAELVGEGLPGARPVAEVVAGGLGTAGRELALTEIAARWSVLLQDDQVHECLAAVGRVADIVMCTTVRLACEAAARGLPQMQGFALVDWLGLRCPGTLGALRDVARVAAASTDPVYAPLVEAVVGHGMSLARAGVVHRGLTRVRGALAPEKFAEAVELLAVAGVEPAFEDRDVHKIVEALLRTCLPEKDHDDRARAKAQLRDVHESSLADGTVRRIIMTFGEDADYEAVMAVLRSPLAAPSSAQEQMATGVPESRTPGQRRYDALMTVLRRGVAGTKGQPSTPKATLVVTMDLQTLRRDLADAGAGDRPGCGSTLADGASISAATIRRLACEADVIPMVLGEPSEIVDQGRRRRLVTPGQRIRLAARDRGCTIPGCTVPATWCDAHHVIPWAQGGRSDLSNYALLCPRHHTWVHEMRLDATVTALGVIWRLR